MVRYGSQRWRRVGGTSIRVTVGVDLDAIADMRKEDRDTRGVDPDLDTDRVDAVRGCAPAPAPAPTAASAACASAAQSPPKHSLLNKVGHGLHVDDDVFRACSGADY